jgi:hypothetical protein
VDESAHHALANAGGREIVGKKEGEQKGSARGSVHWGCYYTTALDIEVDPQRCCLGSKGSFAVVGLMAPSHALGFPEELACLGVVGLLFEVVHLHEQGGVWDRGLVFLREVKLACS